MATFPATPAPSQGSGVNLKPRVNEVKFGDGYSQRSPDGLNNLPASYNLMWKNITETERVTLCAFLLARKGSESFDWVTPNSGGTFKFICRDWSWTYGEYNLVDLRATFEQVYES